MKVTYTIQVCNESRELFSLINFLIKTIDPDDEINVVADSNNVTDKVESVLEHFKEKINVFKRPFDEFGKNCQFHTEMATGDFVFMIDADETPNEILIKHIKKIIEQSGNEIIYIPRMNIHPDLTEEDRHAFGFKVNESGFVNWPDYQGRIYKKCDHIKWSDEMHTRLEGTKKMCRLEPKIELGLWHIKCMNKQTSRWKFDEDQQKYLINPPGDEFYDNLM